MKDLKSRFLEQGKRRKAYYSGVPIVSDQEFDIEEEYLKKMDPDNKYFLEVGSTPDGSRTIQHSFPMLSMSKIKMTEDLNETESQFLSWVNSIGMDKNSLFCFMPKIDGFSLRLRYKDGNFVYACTRGNGLVGELIKYPEEIKGIPKTIPYKSEIDIIGEGFIPQEFKNTDEIFENKSLRNLAYGIASRDNKTEDLKYVHFVAYDMCRPKNILPGPVSHKSMLDYVETFMPYVVDHKLVRVSKLKEDDKYVYSLKDSLRDYLSIYRDSWMYETDGVVLIVDDKTSHLKIDEYKGGAKTFHHFSKAIKPPERTGMSNLIDIEWNVAKDWDIIPIAIFNKVKIGSAEFTNANLINAETVEKLGLRKNDTILIQRANDVIPKIVEVIHGNEDLFNIPTKCPSCGSKVIRKGKHIRCTNKLCSGKSISLIYHWVKENNIINLGIETIKDLYNSGAVKTISDLYSVNVDDALSIIPGYSKGGNRILNINISIQKSSNITEFDMISRIGIPGIKSHALKNLGIYNIEDLMKYQKIGSYISEREKTIHEWVLDKDNIENLTKLKNIIKPTKSIYKEQVNSKNVKFCITGEFKRSRDEIIGYLEDKGYTFTTSVTSKTDCLIKGEGKDGGKVIKAEALGIKIVLSVEEFEKLFP